MSIGLGEYGVSDDPGTVLVASGLGSCVAVTLYDPVARLAGLVHAALPLNRNGRKAMPGKYVDTGVMAVLEMLLERGAQRERLVVRAAGGSTMLNPPQAMHLLDIGRRNVAALELVLARENLALQAADVGGQMGRTVRLDVGTGRMTVRALGREERVLGSL